MTTPHRYDALTGPMNRTPWRQLTDAEIAAHDEASGQAAAAAARETLRAVGVDPNSETVGLDSLVALAGRGHPWARRELRRQILHNGAATRVLALSRQNEKGTTMTEHHRADYLDSPMYTASERTPQYEHGAALTDRDYAVGEQWLDENFQRNDAYSGGPASPKWLPKPGSRGPVDAWEEMTRSRDDGAIYADDVRAADRSFFNDAAQQGWYDSHRAAR